MSPTVVTAAPVPCRSALRVTSSMASLPVVRSSRDLCPDATMKTVGCRIGPWRGASSHPSIAHLPHRGVPTMRRAWLALFLSLLALPAAAEEIGSVGYRFKWLGPNDKIVVEAFDDPDVPGVTCYMSHARTGGIKGAIGLAEDPGEASIACRQVAPIDVAKL